MTMLLFIQWVTLYTQPIMVSQSPSKSRSRRRNYGNGRPRCTVLPVIVDASPASQDRARIAFDCQTAHDLAMISKGSTNENNTDVDRWADARRLRINGKPWRCLNLPARFAGSR